MTAAPNEPSPRNVMLLVLLIAVFAAAVIDVAIPIANIDIAHTFGVLPGTVGQLNSIIAVASVAMALLLAALGDKIRYKGFVLVGILFIIGCDLGLFLSPTFSAVQFVVALNGIGSVLIVVTTQTFIGNFYPMNKKAKAIGWVAAAGALANAISAPIVGFMAGTSRLALGIHMVYAANSGRKSNPYTSNVLSQPNRATLKHHKTTIFKGL